MFSFDFSLDCEIILMGSDDAVELPTYLKETNVWHKVLADSTSTVTVSRYFQDKVVYNAVKPEYVRTG